MIEAESLCGRQCRAPRFDLVEMIHNGEQSRSIGFVEIFETKFVEPSGEYVIVSTSNRPIDAGLAHCPASSDQKSGTDLSPIFPGVITAEPAPGFLAMENGGLLSVGWIVQPIDWTGYKEMSCG